MVESCENVKSDNSGLLTLNKVTKQFGGLHAVEDVCLEVKRGEILGLIGPNGAGKTTLFNLITGLHCPSAGEITFRGLNITGKKSFQICRLGVCRTHQIMKPFMDMTTLENVMVGVYFGHRKRSLPVSQAKEKAFQHLEFTGLATRAQEKARNLTMVNLKRLEITRALATEPEILLLDECMSGLNPSEINVTMKLARQIQELGITLFLIEHVMRVVIGMSDRVIVMHHGKKISEGTPSEVVTDETVIKAYLGNRKV